MPQQQGQSSVRDTLWVKDPDLYDVVMLNDDFTTMDFVVKVLQQVFFKSADEAEALMFDIHQKGQAIVGTYTLDIAESKVNKATSMAREEQFPLRIKLEPHK